MNKKDLKNKYLLMRHGHSLANKEKLIVSSPETGTMQFGLTEKGKKQIQQAAVNLIDVEELIIYSSDFLRTKETSKIIGEMLHNKEIHYTPLLRERFFGSYEKLSDSLYPSVWEKDKTDADNNHNSVESPRQVASRTETLIKELEEKYENHSILLISHGDCLQILQTVFENRSPAEHRSLPHLNVAEVRAV
jgi:probable phosphoglycerate mutase